MATPIKLTQRLSLANSGRSVMVRQQQGNRVRYTEIALKTPIHSLRELDSVTALTKDWPRTEVIVNGEFTPNEPKDSESQD
jgi:hypothetical protein